MGETPRRLVPLLLAAVALLGAAGCDTDDAEGRVLLVDDTGMDDRADPGGWLLVVPTEADPWTALAVPSPGGAGDETLAHAGFVLPEGAADRLGGDLVEVDDDGRFRLEATGEHLVCRVPGPLEASTTRGCVVVDLPVDGGLELTWGEGGLAVSG